MVKLFYQAATIAACFFWCTLSLDAQAPKFSNEFLAIGAGAQSHGMGGAMTASVGGAASGYWNPAGLSDLTYSLQVNAMHAEWFAGIGKYDYLSVGKRIDSGKRKSGIGFTLIRFGVDNIPNTFNLVNPDGSINFDNVTPFSASDYAFLASYARELPVQGLTIGGNVKVVHRRVGQFASAWGFGIDLGAQFRLGKHLRFGLMARDITSTFNAWSFSFSDEEKVILELTDNDIPENSIEVTTPKFSLGVAYETTFSRHFSILGEIDLDLTTDGQRNVLISSKAFNIDPRIGVELGYRSLVFARAGISNFQKTLDNVNGTTSSISAQPNIGVGVRVSRFQVDYALTDIGNVSQVLYSHIFSITVNLNPERKNKFRQPKSKPKIPKRIIEQID
ncbi:MAG: PorV/PorQ family protein [Bacteroidota bacterium]